MGNGGEERKGRWEMGYERKVRMREREERRPLEPR
jgi:hypothetical protein